MPKMRWSDAEAFDELPEDWEESEFEPYDGDEPPPNIALRGVIKKIWCVQFSTGSDGLKVLFEAANNSGEREEYDGWGTFDNIVFSPGSAFRYGPFLELLGISLRDVRNAVVGEEDNTGYPLLKAGTFKMPADGVPCKIRTKAENSEEYGRSIKVATYLPDEPDKRRAKTKTSSTRTKAKSRTATSRRRRDEEEDDEPF